jgi:peroxiredoxin
MEKGDLAGDFELEDETGTPRRLSEFLGKWCSSSTRRR